MTHGTPDPGGPPTGAPADIPAGIPAGIPEGIPEGPLLARLAGLRERVADLVERRSAEDPTAADPLRGLYLSVEAVRHHVRRAAGPERAGHGEPDGARGPADGGDTGPDAGGPTAPAAPADLTDALDPADPASFGDPAGAHPAHDRLHRLSRRLGLTAVDATVLLIALAPDLDRGFEPLYGYLNDDVSRRRATIGLALDVCGLPAAQAGARDLFHPTAPLSASGLLLVEDSERPFLSRSLRVPDRVAAHLLGDDTPDAALTGHIRALPDLAEDPYAKDGGTSAHRLAKLLAAAPLTVYLREQRDGDGLLYAASALRAAGRDALHFTPLGGGARTGGPDGDPGGGGRSSTEGHGPVVELLREARLLGCSVVASPLPERPGPLIRALTVSDVPVLFTGRGPYDPQWCESDPLVLDVPRLPSGAVGTWSAALGLDAGEDPGFDLATTVAPYRLGGDGIARAARSALELAALDGTALTAAHLRLAARQQSASGLERHARRIRPDVGWDDLVLPAGPLGHLRELALRARYRSRVLGDWRLSAGGGRGRGVLALFAGDSGTGKTLSAEVVAADLGLDLYVVQLSSVVDKYVGETEKNLERIFTEADRADSVLLFDEADAVFGKRSEVKDSHDRYANMESAYLLQRLEAFDGIALLTTNLRANIDDAFTRRLDLVVDFPFPDAGQRLALWHHSLTHVPCADDVDPGVCARDFELAGGSIRSAVVTAAYAAVGRGETVTTADLLTGARREYRKAGRLVPGDVGW
ncbi:ATP-binding protein [Streptomyces sp. NBC_01497]|uniref:ATP-binding protein n=1 Tax=Streptomyces sp. NBC_01497 TaxID=2903885 RepID=UPI002E31DAFA|nr:ATP-binding protein [Streptomyces sp. NBC_01497]